MQYFQVKMDSSDPQTPTDRPNLRCLTVPVMAAPNLQLLKWIGRVAMSIGWLARVWQTVTVDVCVGIGPNEHRQALQLYKADSCRYYAQRLPVFRCTCSMPRIAAVDLPRAVV